MGSRVMQSFRQRSHHLLAATEVKSYQDPDSPEYDRWRPWLRMAIIICTLGTVIPCDPPDDEDQLDRSPDV